MHTNFTGVDLGQRQDFTAVAVVEQGETELVLRHLARMPLGTPYTNVVERLGTLMRHPALAGRSRMVVDATGVGAPVVDMLREAGLAGVMTAVTITSGERAHGEGERWHVPRRDLLAGLEVLLEYGELKICRRLGEAERLVRELTSVRMRGGGSEHDDLVMAVGLACWRARDGGVGVGRGGCRGFEGLSAISGQFSVVSLFQERFYEHSCIFGERTERA
jgi:hypothetical protein